MARAINLRRGEAHGRAKLTEADVLAIRARYVWQDRNNGARALSRRYGVSKTTIARIVAGEYWAHVEPERLAA